MKTRTLISILIPVLAALIVTGSCAPAPEITEERGGINQVTFFQAVKDGDVAEVKRFIEAGADVNAQTNRGETAIDIMKNKKIQNKKIIRILEKAGAKK